MNASPTHYSADALTFPAPNYFTKGRTAHQNLTGGSGCSPAHSNAVTPNGPAPKNYAYARTPFLTQNNTAMTADPATKYPYVRSKLERAPRKKIFVLQLFVSKCMKYF